MFPEGLSSAAMTGASLQKPSLIASVAVKRHYGKAIQISLAPLLKGRQSPYGLADNGIPGHDGLTLIRRYGPFDLSSTIRTALEKKLPKLVATEADKRILMLERDQWHVDPAAIAAELECLRDCFPKLALVDEIWIAETHHNRHFVLFDPVRPDRSYAPVFAFDGDARL